jgi:hypothetical protein
MSKFHGHSVLPISCSLIETYNFMGVPVSLFMFGPHIFAFDAVSHSDDSLSLAKVGQR